MDSVDDDLLDILFSQPDELRAQRVLSSEYNRTMKWLRRRCVGRSEYVPVERRDRTDEPWNWLDSKVMQWSFHENNSERKFIPADEYVARILMRPVEQVKSRKNVRYGIRGLDIQL